MSLRPAAKGYFEEVRCLVEKFETWMGLADTKPSEASIEVRVVKSEGSIPF